MTKSLIFCAVLVHSLAALGQVEGEFRAAGQKVSEGFIGLSWKQLSGQESVRLQIASDPEFAHLVRELTLQGQNKVHLSGFENGKYFARLVASNGESLFNSVQFEVAHRDLRTAFVLFALGAGLFVLLLATLLRFSYFTPQQQS